MNELQVTWCQHKESGQFGYIATAALPAWEKLGWDPVGDSHSLEELHTMAVEAEQDQRAAEAAAPEVVEDHTVKEVLDEVGDDPVLAQAALDAEQATGNPRKTLVAALTKVVEAAPDPAAVGDGSTEAGQPGNSEGN